MEKQRVIGTKVQENSKQRNTNDKGILSFHETCCNFVSFVDKNYFAFITFLFLMFISSLGFAQDFTAKTIGDYGNVAVMEVTGNYDAKNPDGSINYLPREIIAKEFFKTHKDVYDFLVIFSSFDFKMPGSETKAFYSHVKNDVRGIGLNVFDGSALFGSNGKLQGVVDMGNLSGLVVDPLDPGFEEASFLLSHELVHRWGAYAKFKDASGNISDALLGRDGTHWSFLLDSRASVLYGNQWQNNGNGTFTSVGARRYYSPLDLYLMGLYEKSQVPPMLLIDNPAINPATLPTPGATISGTARTITIDQIAAAEGERIPGPSDSQKTFKTACIFITTPGTFTGSELYGIENIRGAWVTRFSILTDGQAILDVDVTPTEDIPTNPGIPDSPFTPRTLPSNIDDGVKWLMNNQRSDGSWADLPQTIERETAGTVLTLRNFDIARENFLTGLLWLEATYSGNIDYLSRKIEAFSNAGKDVKALLDEVVSRQNSDGGWGSEKGYLSNPTDTSFVLKSIAAAGFSDPSAVSKAIEYLKSKQNPDGGWGGDDEGSGIQATANVLSAFNPYRQKFLLDGQISQGIAWLMQRQNADGGFGNSPSTVYDTAIAVSTLREFGVSTDTISSGLNYLLNLQSNDGSWYGSPYQTALAVSAVWKATVDPDLSIGTDDITFTPPSVTTVPSSIAIDATIRNLGRTDVPQAKVALYEGAVSETNKIAQQTTGFPGQSSVRVSFPVTINGGNEHRFYISVDPENLVKESNKSNNTALNILYPLSTYDFEILPSGFSVSPNLVDIFQDVKITSRITNKGTINAYDVQVKYYIDEAGNEFDIATATVDIPAGSTVINEMTWRTNKAGENLKLTAHIDPSNSYNELSEANNKAFTYLTVRGSTDPNLTVSYKDVIISPSPAKERGSANISALVKNEGFSTATSVKVNFYKGTPGLDGVLLGSQVIPSLGAGESRPVSFDWVNIMESGERIIYVQVDPENQINEIKEDDNSAFVTLKILSLPDLTLSTNSIAFNPPAPKDGDTVAITVTVQNKGEQNVLNVTVRAHEGNTVIGTQIIPSIAGNSQGVATIAYNTTGKSGPHQITVIVDPDNTIAEQSEDNNQASRSFGVQDANLWVTEQYISPNGDGIKDSTQLFFRLNTPQTVKIAVVSEKGEIVRSFNGSEFENTSGGNLTWDGMNDRGMVVHDGPYQIKILDVNNNILGSLPVIVDNNRSPLTEAIGTKYLLNTNLTCMLPDIAWNWAWFPDESGIVFNISQKNQNTPGYPTGLYTMAPDGEDIFRIIPWEWSVGVDPTYDYYIGGYYSYGEGYELSPDGEKVAFILEKYNRTMGRSELSQLWVVDRDGRNLILLDSYDLMQTSGKIENLKWSLDGKFLVYKVGYPDKLWIIKPDGTGKKNIDSDGGYIDFGYLRWSPDSRRIVYGFGYYNDNGDFVEKIRLSDPSGYKEDISLENESVLSMEWLNAHTLLVRTEREEGTLFNPLWVIEASANGNQVKISDDSTGFILSPDKKSFAFIEKSGDQWSIRISDGAGSGAILHSSPSFERFPSLGDLRWSQDGAKLAFVDSAYEKVDDCHYNGYLCVIDLRTREKIAFKVSDAEDVCAILSSYHVSTQEEEIWMERGILHFDSNYRTKELDLTKYFKNKHNPYRVRISQQGMDAAHIDHVALSINGKHYVPTEAVNISKGEDILPKVDRKDNQVADVHNSTIDFVWEGIPGGGRISLIINAREEDLGKRKALPFRYPKDRYYSVTLQQNGSIKVDGNITDEDHLPQPLFREYSRPTTGHPDGFTYGYVQSDGKYLYGVLDFTVDNTLDDGKDWASLEILTRGGAKTFVVNDSQQEYGKTSFTYTDKVNYQHNVYEFMIPLGEIGVSEGDTVQIAFNAYGTAGRSGENLYYYGNLKWMPDNLFLVAEDNHGVFAINSESGEKVYLPIEGYFGSTQLSPYGRYITSFQSPDPLSVCVGYTDLWAIRSLLNLTADLRVKKEMTAVILKGTAADLNFEGFVLEFADTRGPNVWTPISPPSDMPVMNDVFTTWVPPYEGTFYVRLTVWDKAGNVAQDRKRVSWGLSASITNLYKTLEIFSPNGDGVKDTVELHYKVLEPVHLEFYVYDEKGNLKRTFSKDHPFPTDDFIAWDGRDESGRVVPDGKYKIRVFDYEFFVEVDNTFPEVNIELGSVQLVSVAEEIYEITAEIVGHAFDHHIKNWVIEYGEGDNPPGWFEFIRGVDLLVKRDDKGNPILNPVKDTSIERFIDADIEWLVGKKLRITAEDFAGNKSTAVTEFLEEKIILSRWDSQSVLDTIPAHLARPGLHSLGGLESIRLPIVSFNVQYWVGDRWLDTSSVMDPPSGGIHLEWDNSALNLQEGYAVRLKTVDILGQEHYSNALRTRDLFDLYLNKTCQVEARNSLFEKLRLLKFEAAIYPVISDSQWKDYFVLDSQRGDSLPEGEFAPPLPPLQSGMKYAIRMIGISESGEEYESRTVSYPACTGFGVDFDVTYDETDCGLISGKATLQSKLVLGKEFSFKDVAFRTLSYYLQKPEGFQLLRQFDLTREEWGSVNIDTVNMPEGNYPVEVIFTYLDLVENTDREASASSILVVDRVLPTARITYPGKSMMLCPVKVSNPKGDWYGIPVEGIATDNNGIKEYALYYGIGENPSGWIPATTRKMDVVLPISGDGPIQGSLGLWDITPLRGETFSLKLKAVDKAGNVKCDTTSFSFDNLIEIVHLSKDNPLFSPNGDGILDEMEIRYEIDEYATVDAKVFKLIKAVDGSYGLDSLPVRTIASALQHLGGMENASWDGRDDSDTVVADGLYGIAVFAKDSCGNTNLKWTSVEVDNTPPQTVVTYPRPPDPIGNIVEIRGTADDLNFQNYLLETSKVDQPDTWFLISSNNNTVKDDVLGTWNNSGLDGTWTLRLTATDKVGNKNTTTVTIDLGARKKLIKDLTANPRLFSPNNDGKLDTAKIDYELTYACDVKIEFLDLNGVAKKSYTTTVSSGGTYTYTWDGTGDTGGVVPDGLYTLRLAAALSSYTSVTQEESITLVVDSTAPIVDLRQPLNHSYLKDILPVIGTISDKNITDYSITYTGEGGSSLFDKANQNRENYFFGILPELPEGSYMLYAEAKDLGENVARRNIAFTVDRTPPKATLETPKDGEFYGAEKNTVSINGAIVEKNLETFSLRYGPGDNPAQWTELMSGNTPPSNPQLLSWKVGKNDGIPDGLYTLSLYAKDKAGLTGEAKVKITIDNTPPAVLITSPVDGNYIKAAVDIRGTASDPNLEKYTLEISEGQCGSAFKWTALKASTTSVNDGLLAAWQALPPDGDYCLRLTAVDKIGNRGEARTQVKVDTHPPEAPVLSGKVENKTEVRLNWISSNEPDLAGYNLYRDKQKVNTGLISAITYLDQNLKEGIFTYTVKAVDLAGNESTASNELKLKVDLTGPEARIRSPQDGSRVSSLVDMKGTAFSSEDFKQYRISIGQGSSPSAWMLIRTSPVPISYGSLVQWDTIGLEGSYSIKLEAEDLSGNISTHQTVVTIDNIPPAKPVLISATRNAPPNDSDVTVTWQANTEPDLAGCLVYRNDQLANVSGIVIGDLKPYLIIGTTYLDKALPDGKFKYYLIAVDLAGNMSEPSNTLEVEIDTHSPRATIVEPTDKSKFQSKALIRAETPDIDMASVQFQYKRSVDSDTMWANLGTAVKKSPYITYIDPTVLGLTFGDYNLRAVATDLGGRTDTTPPFITLTFTDVTPPEAPKELKTLTNGKDVTLTWAANKESDLSGYNIYRTAGTTKTKVNPSVVTGITYQDQGLADGPYAYEVTALDTYGNESEPSNSAAAKVYAPSIEQVYTPTGQEVIEIKGKNAAFGSSVEVWIGSMSAGIVNADSQGNFTLANLNLNLGENRIAAKATDGDGNISRSSELVVVVYNEPPAAPTGLTASVQDYNVKLRWDPNSDSDLAGYNLYRNDEIVNGPVAVTSGDISASSYDYYYPPEKAFDSNPATYWMSDYSYGTFTPVWWEIDLQAPELISHIEIHWGSEADGQGGETLYAGKDYEIQVWSGYAWIAQTKVTGNNAKENAFDFNPSYRTDKIRIYITDTTVPGYYKWVRISEIGILKENLITQTSYDDTDLDDGEYGYRVTAVDYYGFESEPSIEAKAVVGDVIPPAKPQNLQAQASGHDVLLTWSPNAETGLAGYNAYRNTPQGLLKLNTALITGTTYTDANLKNGTYSYRVTAVDKVGNESLPSNEASATVSVEPPQPPGNLRVSSIPEGHALRATWDYSSGAAAGYNLYRSPSPGGPYIKVNSSLISLMTFLDQGLTNGVACYYVVTAADAFGNESGYSNEAMGIPSDQIPPPKPGIFFPTLSGIPAVLYKDKTDLSGNAEPGSAVDLFKEGVPVGKTTALENDLNQSFSVANSSEVSLSPDGRTLAYASGGSLWLNRLATGTTTRILEQANSPLWSPDGSRLAFQFRDSSGNYRIGIYAIETGSHVPLTDDSNVSEGNPSWSFDGMKIAFESDKGGPWNIWIKDLSSGSLTQMTNNNYAHDPKLSPDGKKLAYFEEQGLFVLNLASGQTVNVDPQNEEPQVAWSPDSKSLAFVSFRTSNADIFVVDTATWNQIQMTDSTSDDVNPLWSPDGQRLAFMKYDGSYSIWTASSISLGQERLIQDGFSYVRYLLWTKSGGIAYLAGNQLNTVYLQGHFSFKDIDLDVGENIFHSMSTDSSGNASSPSDEISVIFDTGLTPDLSVTMDDVLIYPPSPIEGDQASIQMVVWNQGGAEAKDVDVDIYLWDSGGRVELLKSANIPYLAPASGEVIPMTWGTAGKTGTNKLIVVVDPEDRINEVLETNNSVTREFFVVKEEKISMTTTLDSNQYGSNQDVKMTIHLQNSSSGRDVVLGVRIEDLDGYEVISLDPIHTYLAYASQQTYSLLWNTESTFAGSYRVRTVMKNEPTVVAENLVPFAIVPEIDIDSTVVTDRTGYDSNENVLVRFDVKNKGRNYAIPQMNGKVRIVDPGNIELFSEEKEIKNLLPGMTTTLNSTWNTGLHVPGDYQAVLEISLEGQQISRQSVLFRVNASVVISGQLAVSPPLVFLGNTVRTNYTLQNSGNADVMGLGVKVAVVDSETQTIMSALEETVDLIMNGSQTGRMTFSTEGYGIKTYAVNLDVVNQGNQRNIARTSFTVKDGTLPVVSVLSPILDRFYNSKIDISALAADYVSGIDKVEYQVDGGSWKLLLISDSSQGRYSSPWDPIPSDEGVRTISIRATDRAGNISLPVSVQFTLDLTPPNVPFILSPQANSTLSTETIEIKGTAEPGSAVEMVFGSVFRTEANLTTGEFVYTGVKLIPGENKFIFKASDRAGNVSSSTEYAVRLRIVPNAMVTTDRVEYKPNEVVTITSTIQNPSQYYALENLVAKVSVADSQGKILSAEEKSLPAIPLRQEVKLVTIWNTSTYPMGTYTVRLEVLEGGAVLSDSTMSFEISGALLMWAKTYGGKHHDVGYSIRQTSEGGYIVVGETWSFDAGQSDAWVLKLDGNGETEWQRAYGNKHHDVAYSIQQTRDSGYIMAGETDAEAPFFGDFWVVKLNSSGDIEWQKTYGQGWANSIQQTLEGGYIVAGMNQGDAWVIKLNGDGEIEWQKAFRGMQGDWAHSVKETSEGGYIVAGTIKGDAWVFKLSAQGNIEWQKTYGSCSLDAIFSIQQTEEGGYVVASLRLSPGPGHSDVWILKLDSLGNIEWQQGYGGRKHDFAHSIEQTKDGGYIVAGWTQANSGEGLDGWILRLDPRGEVQWQKAYGGHKHDAFHSVQQTSDGGYAVTGWTQSFGEGGFDAWVLKLNSEGDVLDCREAFIEAADVVPYNTKASVSRSHVKGENTHVCPRESHQSAKETHAIPGDVCMETEPDIAIDPDFHDIDFGNVKVKHAGTKSCYVSNQGSGDLEIKSIRIIDEDDCHHDPSVFSLSHDCTTLPPGSLCEITVQFKPTAPGLQSATLEIQSNDPDENPVKIILSGNGIRK